MPPKRGQSVTKSVADIPLSDRPDHYCFQLRKHRQRAQGAQPDKLDRDLLLSDPNLLSATLWETQRYFRAEGLLALRLCRFWSWLSVLRSLPGHQAADCGEGQSSSWPVSPHLMLIISTGFPRHRRWWHDHRREHLDERHRAAER